MSDQTKKYQRDHEIAPAIGLSVSFLRKDRRSRQLIPYHRVGDACLYRLDEVLAAIESMRVGGKQQKRAKA
jgi:hypothetical protein